MYKNNLNTGISETHILKFDLKKCFLFVPYSMGNILSALSANVGSGSRIPEYVTNWVSLLPAPRVTSDSERVMIPI